MNSCSLIKTDQLCQNTKNTKKQLALYLPKNTYNRFIEYATETERLAIEAENKAKKLQDLKKISYELIKDWDNTVVNIKKRRRNELLLRRKKAEEEKIKLIKKLTEENAAERAVIVKEARKLLMYRKPQCRLINSALFASECFRELNAQLEFNKMLKEMEKEEKNKWIEKIKEEAEHNRQKEQKEIQDRWKKMIKYRDDLTKQISQCGSYSKQIELQERAVDKENLHNLIEELNLLEKRNTEELIKKRKELQAMFVESLESKKRHQEEIKKEEEHENYSIEAYRKAKEHLTELTQKKWKEMQDQKLKRSELMAQRCAAICKYDETDEKNRLEKAINENEKKELEKAKAKKDHEEKMRAELLRYQAEYEKQKEKNKREEKNRLAWETFQRIKRDEFNIQMKLEETEREWKKKMDMANELKKQVDERRKEREEERTRNDDSIYNQVLLQKMNEQILAYGQEVFNESKGVRPLFPIIKTIQNFKKENRLLPPAKIPEPIPPKKEVRMKKKIICPKLPNEQIFYLG
ncbi:golgin subfamily A member 6-like protein 6 [Chelonus insularis]|uniref:golgin subfamily A member 6-like protein 6 n=1 Tax=Chelonus insularis TaxID=460826 RepID=UPI00158D2E00|nr:golgin subfamily A member 6-like protein 6 [Chelonus insularis]